MKTLSFICATLGLLCSLNDAPDVKSTQDLVERCVIQENSLLPEHERFPIDFVVSVSALETGWWTSRFFQIGINAFGVKNIDVSEPHIKSLESPSVMVKAYHTLCESVYDFMLLLNTDKNYIEFREVRLKQWIINEVNIYDLFDTMYNYAEDPLYIEKLYRTAKKVSPETR